MGGGRSTKKHSRKGKLNEKNSCTPINPKKYSYNGLKNSYKEFDNEKKVPAARKFPSPPTHNFSNGPSLTSNARTTATSDCHIIDSDISCV